MANEDRMQTVAGALDQFRGRGYRQEMAIKAGRLQVDGTEGKSVTVRTPAGDTQFTGIDLLLKRALPNFYFHCTTAYDILRHNGVDLGKRDFMG